jgi:hypothetical protein
MKPIIKNHAEAEPVIESLVGRNQSPSTYGRRLLRRADALLALTDREKIAAFYSIINRVDPMINSLTVDIVYKYTG